MRLILNIALALTVSACASTGPKVPVRQLAEYSPAELREALCGGSLTSAARTQLISRTHARTDKDEVRVVVRAPTDAVQRRVVAALSDCKIAPTQNTPGLVRSELPRQIGWVGQYELTVTVSLSGEGDSTLVLMYGDETSITGAALNPIRSTYRIGASSMGRAYETFLKLIALGDETAADAQLAQAGGEEWVGDSMRKMYFKKGCALAGSVALENIVTFKSTSQAEAAGYARSGAPGC